MIFVHCRAVSAVERHLVSVAAELEAAKQSASDWQTRCETAAAVHSASQVDSSTALQALRQQLEDEHRSELEQLTNSRQYKMLHLEQLQA